MAEVAGFGTKIGYSLTSGGALTDIAEVVSITPPKYEVTDIESTHMQSTNKWKTYQAGLKEGGETEVTIHFDKVLYATLHGTLFGVDYFYGITFNDGVSAGSVLKFPGYLKSVGPTVEIDGLTTVTLTIKVSGEPTFTAGT
jgi:hypothetical protein